MQWKQAGRLSLIALMMGGVAGCRAGPSLEHFGVPHPPAWQAQMGAAAEPPDRIQSPSVTPQDSTAQAMTAYDEVQLGAWPAETAGAEAQADTGIWLSHPQLPVPSYVEVTRLDTGRTVLARVAARASGAKPMVLALSDGLARQLALGQSGLAAFRVRRVNPPEAERAALRQGQKAAERIDTPEFLLVVLRKQAANLPNIRAPDVRLAATQITRPPAQAEPVHPQKFMGQQGAAIGAAGPSAHRVGSAPPANPARAEQTGWFVQIAALSNAQNAQRLARQIGGQVRQQQGLYRVLSGPFASLDQARAALGPLAAKGYPDARITR